MFEDMGRNCIPRRHLPVGPEKGHDKPQRGQRVSEPRYKAGTFLTRSRCVVWSTAMSSARTAVRALHELRLSLISCLRAPPAAVTGRPGGYKLSTRQSCRARRHDKRNICNTRRREDWKYEPKQSFNLSTTLRYEVKFRTRPLYARQGKAADICYTAQIVEKYAAYQHNNLALRRTRCAQNDAAVCGMRHAGHALL